MDYTTVRQNKTDLRSDEVVERGETIPQESGIGRVVRHARWVKVMDDLNHL